MSIYYSLPIRNVFGEGATQEAGELVKSLGAKKRLIATDKYLRKTGMTDRIQEILKKAGVETSIFTGAEPNPTDKSVEAEAISYQGNQCDSIISLGGGSSRDCIKGIGPVATNGGKIVDFEGIDKSSNPMVPLMAVNTTTGAVSEIIRLRIITDTSRKMKMAIVDWRVTSQVAISDPELMKDVSPALTTSTGMDTSTHAIETYVSTGVNPLTDAATIMPIKMVIHYLSKAVANENCMKAGNKVVYAQYLAGIAFSNASLGYIHTMVHQPDGFCNLPHGVCSAILLPYVESYSPIDDMNRLRDVARTMGVQVEGTSVTCTVEETIETIKRLSRQLEIPSNLKRLRVRERDFSIMANNAKKGVCQLTNPRAAIREQVIEIYRQAYVEEQALSGRTGGRPSDAS